VAVDVPHSLNPATQAKNFPACVVYPSSSSDVQTAIKAIKANNVQFAVKAGGHQCVRTGAPAWHI